MSVPKLTDWQIGDDIRSRAHHQEPIDALKHIFNLPNAGVGKVGANQRFRFGSPLVGTITTTGPAGQADFSNEFHWCQINYLEGGELDTSHLTIRDEYSDEEDSEEKNIVPVIYFPDIQAHSHSLRLGAKVVIFPLWTASEEDDSVLTRVAVPIDQPGVFPVYVEKTGGNNGTATSTANYTYTVRALNGATMGTSVTLAHPRPNGTMTFQAGTNGLGLAFYVPNGTNPATLKLWDAGEVRGTTTCSVP